MAKKKASKKTKVSKAKAVKPAKVEEVAIPEVEVVEVVAEAVPEEAPVAASDRCNRRLTHKQTAHVPGPRRRPKFLPPELQSTIAVDAEGTDEAVGAATAEPEAKSVREAPGRKQGLQKPMTFGSVDG
jgi:hypothetical protein